MAPAMNWLRARGEHVHYETFQEMTETYCADFEGGNAEAIAAMFDFYGGATGVFAAWPARVRAHAIETTRVIIIDWASAYNFPLSRELLTAINVPTLIMRAISPPAVQRAIELLAASINGAVAATVQDAAHFMIATHAHEVRTWLLNISRPSMRAVRPPIGKSPRGLRLSLRTLAVSATR
jgi:hypothetical protein